VSIGVVEREIAPRVELSVVDERSMVTAPRVDLSVVDERSIVTPWWPSLKRCLDVAAAALLLLLTLPIFVCVAIAIKLDSRGPVFYRVRRVGYRGRPFLMLKFRKMYDGVCGAPLTRARDPRLTRVGAFLVRVRVDELPQLWDVLCGRMSIIGPRPEDPRFVGLYGARFDRILSVRPGITGITQLAFAAEDRILDMRDPIADYVERILPQKVALDELYMCRSRLLLDLSVIWWTVVTVVLRRPVAVDRTTARMRIRRRPRADVGERVAIVAPLASTDSAS
jgi:lipopolysaccharide/colanic/teichoic acid biosynthesis glycosyltransferase